MAWKMGETKMDDFIILNQLFNKTIYIEDNNCEILNEDYIKNKKNKISYRHIFSYLPTEFIEKIYGEAMRHYYQSKVFNIPRQHGAVKSYRLKNHRIRIMREPDDDRLFTLPYKNFDKILDSNKKYRTADSRLNLCIWTTKKGKLCKCSTGGCQSSMKVLKIRKPYQNGFFDNWGGGYGFLVGKPHHIEYIHFGVCGRHYPIAKKLPEEERERVALEGIKARFGVVEKHGIWCRV